MNRTVLDVPLRLERDLPGAPLRIGDRVRISPAAVDATIDERFVRQHGEVVAFVFDQPETQYPHDPLVEVRVEELGTDLFFPVELRSPAQPAQVRVGRAALHSA